MPERPDFYFFHIPKTAGTSVARVLRSIYTQEETLPAYTYRELAELPPDAVQRHRCIIGHLGPIPFEMATRPLTTMTVLRDPLDRTVSAFRYARREIRADSGKCRDDAVAPYVELGLDRALDAPPVRASMTNTQARWLAARVDPSLFQAGSFDVAISECMQFLGSISDDELLARAKARLDSMAIVGTVARLPETLGYMCRWLGADPPEDIPSANAAPETDGRSYREQVGPELATLIDEITVVDRQVLQYADELLTQRLTEEARRARVQAGLLWRVKRRLRRWIVGRRPEHLR